MENIFKCDYSGEMEQYLNFHKNEKWLKSLQVKQNVICARVYDTKLKKTTCIIRSKKFVFNFINTIAQFS